MKLHEKIYYYRKKAGLSQDSLAEKLGVSRQAVSKWETAESVPETGKLLALAAALGITVDELLSESAPEEDGGPRQASDAGCFTYDGGAQTQPDSSPDWLESLPKYLRGAAKRWGWLAGVYVALSGLPLVIVGTLASVISNRMLGSFNDFTGSVLWGGLGSTVTVDGMELPISGSSQFFNPVAAVGSVMIVIGVALRVAGAALAIFLKKKSK